MPATTFRVNDRLSCFGTIWTVTRVTAPKVTVCIRHTDSFGKMRDIDHKEWHPRTLATHMVKVVENKS
mgnify:FL=1